MKKQYQQIAEFVAMMIAGWFILDQVFSAIVNAKGLLTTLKSSVTSSIILLSAWILVELAFRRGMIHWETQGVVHKPKRLGKRTRAMLLGMLVLMWVPRLFDEPTHKLLADKGQEVQEVVPNPSAGPASPTVTIAAASPTTTAITGTAPSVCGGLPEPLATPSGPQDFDRQFGFTSYHVANSSQVTDSEIIGLARNVIRSVFVDETGVWLGYGESEGDITGSGISHVSNAFQQDSSAPASRHWEACRGVEDGPLARLVNAITKDAHGDLWVATDGDGVWRLQGDLWEQFVFDPSDQPGEPPGLPNRTAFTIVPEGEGVLVGTLDGIVRYNGVAWSRVASAGDEAVHAYLPSDVGATWIGYVDSGVRLIEASGVIRNFKVDNSGLSDNDVRAMVMDNEGAVWIGTWGGGISVYSDGDWKSYRAESSSLPSDNVNSIVKDTFGRIWAGTDQGTSYFDGSTWHLYNSLNTFAIAFGTDGKDRCPDAVSVWIGTNGAGLTYSRLPPPSTIIADYQINGISNSIQRGTVFSPEVTITLAEGYGLTAGDFLHTADQTTYTASPLVGVPDYITVQGGDPYTFEFEGNPFTAPQEPGHYQTTWRLWQCSRYVDPSIQIEFTVGD